MTEQRKGRTVAVVCLLLFVILLTVATVVFWDSLTAMVADPEAFRSQMEGYGLGGKCIFTLLMAAQVILAPIPGHPFEVVGGYSFGILGGLLLTSIGAAIGSAVAFWISRRFGAKVVKCFYSDKKLQKVFFLKASDKQNAFTFIFFLIPGVPKDMLAYFMGLTEMRFSVFMLLSIVGRLPGIFIAVLGGAAIGTRSITAIVIFFLCFILFLLLSLLLYKKKMPPKNK
ncbi:MAG: TVP38/TMEM64 family protein [Clostridia bacterium]|nr:TVP38/TMEM64 family protein [Clostridia bacterium]